MKRIAFLVLALAACAADPAPAPADPLDAIITCDYCAVDFRAPTCTVVGDVTTCAAPGGTWWEQDLSSPGQPAYRRFRQDPQGATDLCLCDATTCGATGR